MSQYFNTSLFAKNDPQLVEQVNKICNNIGFEGLSNIKLPWNMAKSLVKGSSSKFYRDLEKVHDIVFIKKHPYQHFIYEPKHIRLLRLYIVDSGTINTMYKHLKMIIEEAEKAYKESYLWQVKYGILG